MSHADSPDSRQGRSISIAERAGIRGDLIRLLLSLDQLKDVTRQNPLASSERQERTAEHAWHLATAVLVLKDLADEPFDVEHAVVLAIVHDIPEVFVGDTFAFSRSSTDRRSREQAAIDEFASRFQSLEVKHIRELWEEYEFVKSPEAKFVMALDIILPIILNFTNGTNTSWVRHNVHAKQVLSRIDQVSSYSAPLARYARGLVEEGLIDGLLLP
jgi:putative hydrolase of HD superfamily